MMASRVTIGAVALAALAVLSGCGGGAKDEPAASGTSRDAQTSTPDAARLGLDDACPLIERAFLEAKVNKPLATTSQWREFQRRILDLQPQAADEVQPVLAGFLVAATTSYRSHHPATNTWRRSNRPSTRSSGGTKPANGQPRHSPPAQSTVNGAAQAASSGARKGGTLTPSSTFAPRAGRLTGRRGDVDAAPFAIAGQLSSRNPRENRRSNSPEDDSVLGHRRHPPLLGVLGRVDPRSLRSHLLACPRPEEVSNSSLSRSTPAPASTRSAAAASTPEATEEPGSASRSAASSLRVVHIRRKPAARPPTP